METNIADWIAYWDHFNRDLYIAYLIAKQNNESQERIRENLE